MSKKLIVFDLDGTLLDTSNDLLDCVNHCLLSVDLKPVVYEDLTFLVGQGARAMITRAFELNKANLSEAELDRLFDLFIEYYTDHMPGTSRPMKGYLTRWIGCLLQGTAMRFVQINTREWLVSYWSYYLYLIVLMRLQVVIHTLIVNRMHAIYSTRLNLRAAVLNSRS